ncbi:hypothetical protein NQ317_019659 [Molorchus minor]|uniref:Uncharacterized protein n=1 Tax=Molorchus minor TaxID=1323400 RepID=A0ABQ9J0C9_9CUCU|nr:hypothetical protein NQ317_019659 [Molorchus minor]
MKLLFVVVALTTIVLASGAGLTEEQKQKLSGHHKECITESGVDNELVSKARKGEFTEDPKLKDHLFCLAKKIGFMNDSGDIKKDVLKTKVGSVVGDDSLADKLIDQCAVKKSSPQETAYETVKCYSEKTSQRVSVI